MLASVAEQYMIAKSFEKPITMHENTIMLNVSLARTILFIDLLFYLFVNVMCAKIVCFCNTECKFIVRFMLNYRVKTVLINKKGQA